MTIHQKVIHYAAKHGKEITWFAQIKPNLREYIFKGGEVIRGNSEEIERAIQ